MTRKMKCVEMVLVDDAVIRQGTPLDQDLFVVRFTGPFVTPAAELSLGFWRSFDSEAMPFVVGQTYEMTLTPCDP